MSPFMVRATQLHVYISPKAGGFKGVTSFGSRTHFSAIFVSFLGGDSDSGGCLPCSEGGIYFSGPFANPQSKIRQVLPNDRQVPSLVPPGGDPSTSWFTVPALVTTLLIGT